MKRVGRVRWPRVLSALLLCLALGLLASCGNMSADGDEGVAKAHYSRHLAFRSQNQLDKAATELELAIKSDAAMYHAYYQLGLIYQTLDQKERARAAWERGLDAARQGPERSDYPRAKSIAEMESALASLEPLPPLMPPSPMPGYQTPAKTKPKAKTALKSGAKPSAASSSQGYAVLVSSNQQKSSALHDQKRLAAAGFKAEIVAAKGKKGTWHRVWVGCCGSLDQAQKTAAAVKRKGFSQATAMKR